MELKILSKNIEDYLVKSEIIDYENPQIQDLSSKILKESKDEIDFIKNAFEYVRDKIPHSADIKKIELPIKASDVLKAGHGVCFAKSNLLAAILRSKNVPCGLCYQKLQLDPETDLTLIIHGLVAVYFRKFDKWLRLDARGNKEGVNAQFSLDNEQLAFIVDSQKGEKDYPEVFASPDSCVIDCLCSSKDRIELWSNLPVKLSIE